jgi:Mg-chelatase subunit ChlI
MATFNIKSEATKPLYAGVGVTDLAVEAIRDYVAEAQKRLAGVQKNVRSVELEPKALRDQAVTRVNARVDALAKDAKARRTSIEKRVAELQGEAKALPTRVQALVDENVATVNSAYGDLVNRGEGLVTRIRRQESTQATATAARTTTAKAKTTKTQATKATTSTAKKTTGTAKKSAATAKKTAAKKSAPAKSSAKATTTAAKTTASNATQAVTEAAEKVGD